MDNTDIMTKSKVFALRVIVLYKYLSETKNEHVMSRQLLQSSTAIGLRVRDVTLDQPIVNYNAALRAADESAYWLELLYGSQYLDKEQFSLIYSECSEIIFLLMSLVKTQNIGRNK